MITAALGRRRWSAEAKARIVAESAYLYAPGRGAKHAIGSLAGFSGILQVDAYAAYRALAEPARDGGPVTLASVSRTRVSHSSK